jgi:hypothetical protein
MLKFLAAVSVAGPLLCVFEVSTGPPASALDRQLQLTNTTRLPIIELYAAQNGSGEWRSDMLGEDFLRPGDTVVITVDDQAGYCRFDFKAVFDDGTELIRRDINVCALQQYVISYR